MENMENREEEYVIDFKKVYKAIKKWWLACLLIIIITISVSMLFTDRSYVGDYVASGKLMVNEKKYIDPEASPQDSLLNSSDIQLSKELIKVYSELIKSDIVSSAVIKNLNLSISSSDYNEMLTVGPSNESKIIEIIISAEDERLAVPLVDEIMEVFTNEVGSIVDVESVMVLNQASIISVPTKPAIIINPIIGLVAGTMLSSGFIFLLVLLDNKIKTKAELKEIFDYPVIGEVLYLSDKKNARHEDTNNSEISDKVFVVNEYESLASEGIRNIRAGLLLKQSTKESKVISIMSSLKGQGKTTIAINLAVSLSQIEKKVLLMDCDLRSPSIKDDLDINSECGLIEAVNGSKTYSDCVVTYLSNLDILCANAKTAFASEFVQSNALKSFIEKVSKEYDYIIIDSPSIELTSDALIISTYTDGSLLVIAAGENDRASLTQINEHLHTLNTNVIGVILNNKTSE